MKNLKSFLLIFVMIFFVGCKQTKYVVRIQPSFFNELTKFGVEKTIFQNEKILIELSPEISLQKDELRIGFLSSFIHQSDLLNEFSNQKNTQTLQNSDDCKTWIINQTAIFPCVNFQENPPTFLQAINERKISFYKFDKIPQNMIALSFEKDGNKIYADDENYPFYENKIGKLNILKLKQKKIRQKKDLLAYQELDNWYKKISEQCKEDYISPEIVFVAAAGDIMIARGVEDTMIWQKKPDSIFTTTLPILKNNDITIGNLEGVVTNRWDNATKTYTFKFKKKALPYLKDAGFDYFMLTNNHSYDYGEEGFKDTLKAFTEYDIKTSGAGLTKKDAEKWFYSTVKSQKIAIQSCGAYPVERSGFNGKTTATATDKRAGILWEGDDFVNLVKQESKNDSFIIVNVHGGQEYVTKPSAEQKKFYKKLCDSGAKVVFGSHPHVLQPVEMYNGSLIVWSLGNFVFNGMQEMPGAQESMIIRVGIINNKLVYYEKYDAELDGMIVKLKN